MASVYESCKSVGERIKEYLDQNGIKQSFVAEQAGIKLATFNDMLNKRKRIDADSYFAICDAIRVPLDQFRMKPSA